MCAAFHNEDNSAGWIVYNSVSDTLFLVDITINFRTGVHFEGIVLQRNDWLCQLLVINPKVDFILLARLVKFLFCKFTFPLLS